MAHEEVILSGKENVLVSVQGCNVIHSVQVSRVTSVKDKRVYNMEVLVGLEYKFTYTVCVYYIFICFPRQSDDIGHDYPYTQYLYMYSTYCNILV